MWKLVTTIILLAAVPVSGIEIKEPVEGKNYYTQEIDVRVIVETAKTPSDTAFFTLNGESDGFIPRIDTDWYTYMRNSLRQGYSESYAPVEPDILWTAAVTGHEHEFCSPVIVDGTVYYMSDEQSVLFALDAATGNIRWEYDVVREVDDAVTVTYGNVYVPADSAWCLDALTGGRIWAVKGMPGSAMNGTPSVAGGKAFFTNVLGDNVDTCRVYALDAYTGSEIWARGFSYYTTGCVTLAGDYLLLPTDGGPLYCLNAATGATVWTNTDAEDGYWDSSPAVEDGVIYIGGRDQIGGDEGGCAHAIDLETGGLIWETKVADYWLGVEPTPAIYGDKIFLGYTGYFHESGKVVAIYKETGRIAWSVQSKLHGSVGVADGVVYWAEHYGDGIYAADAETGDIIWEYNVPNCFVKGMQSSPSITDGVMYVAATNGYLYAFGTGMKYTYETTISAPLGENTLAVTAFDSLGNVIGSDEIMFTVRPEPPQHIYVSNYPNPCRNYTVIKYSVPVEERVMIRVFDVAGRLVAEIDEGLVPMGDNTSVWDCQSHLDVPIASGIYFCEIEATSGTGRRKICVIR